MGFDIYITYEYKSCVSIFLLIFVSVFSPHKTLLMQASFLQWPLTKRLTICTHVMYFVSFPAVPYPSIHPLSFHPALSVFLRRTHTHTHTRARAPMKFALPDPTRREPNHNPDLSKTRRRFRVKLELEGVVMLAFYAAARLYGFVLKSVHI